MTDAVVDTDQAPTPAATALETEDLVAYAILRVPVMAGGRIELDIETGGPGLDDLDGLRQLLHLALDGLR